MRKRNWIIALLLAALLCTLAGCKEEVIITTGEDPAPDTGSAAEDITSDTQTIQQEPEPVPEPEPTVITVVVADPLDGLSLEQANPSQKMVLDCMYLRAMYRLEGELVSDVLSGWEHLGAYSWRLSLYEGITDTEGNAFTAQDLVSCIPAEAVTAIAAVDELTVELTLMSDKASALERVLCAAYLVTDEARAAAGGLPAGFGPYSVAPEQTEGALTLTRNEGGWKVADAAGAMLSAEAELIRFVYEPDPVLRAGYMATDRADVVYALDWELVQVLEGGFKQELILGDECVSLFFNMDEDCLMVKRPGISSGLVLALERNALLIGAGSTGELADGIMPSDTVGFTPFGYAQQDLQTAEDVAYDARYRGQTLTLLCNEEYAAIAYLILEQCGAAGFDIEIVTTAEDIAAAASQTEWDMAIAPVTAAGNAADTYSACFAAGESGATWFNFSRADVLYLAGVVSTQAGYDRQNIAMLESWLAENPLVVGLYTQGSYCLVADTAGDYVMSDTGVIPGALTPRVPEAAE